MKTTFSIVLMMASLNLFAIDNNEKDKSKEFTVQREIPVSAEKLWNIVAENFADIAKSHPQLASSHYVEGTPKTGEGCTRVCNLSDDGKKYTQEKIVNYNPEEMSFKAEITHLGGLPLDASQSYMIYDIEVVDESNSIVKLNMYFLTDPAFMGALAKGKFKKTIEDYTIAIQHHALTGEDVDPDNFKEIKKLYKE